jgi:hypothetical protein
LLLSIILPFVLTPQIVGRVCGLGVQRLYVTIWFIGIKLNRRELLILVVALGSRDGENNIRLESSASVKT